MIEGSEQLTHLLIFAQSVGIGFLVGLERERHDNSIAGLRTFTLIAMAGSLSGYISAQSQNMVLASVILILVSATLLVAQNKSKADDPNTTTVLAGVMTFGLGYILWLGHTLLPAAIAITMTALLYFRSTLREVPRRLTHKDIASFLQFSAVAFILLPILPNETYGPYAIFNPYQTGWLVVLISGISLIGYVTLRLLGGRVGLLIIGLLGGLVSTTATTLVFSRHSQQNADFSRAATTIIMLSHLALFVRIGILVIAVNISLLEPMIAWLVGGLLMGVSYILWCFSNLSSDNQRLPKLDVHNPAELKTAVGFSIGFTLVLLLVAWMNDLFSAAGVYLVAFFSGLTDVDAITISNLKLVSSNMLAPAVAVNAVLIAFGANLLFKLGIVFTVAHSRLRIPLSIGFGLMSLGAVTGLLIQGMLKASL